MSEVSGNSLWNSDEAKLQPSPKTPSDLEMDNAPNSPSKSASNLYLFNLSKFETIGIAALIGVMLIALITSIVVFNKLIYLKPLVPEGLDLPIEGKNVTIKSVETYWRKPVTEGENKDIFRRGTKLLPVLELHVDGSSGALRVLFRNGKGSLIGDNINRRISGKKELKVAATAGFKDMGMHASYRTDDSKPWTAQVLEGPSEKAPLEKFETLFEIEISPILK